MINGLRVVRGPDWQLKNQDGGADHVGTVVSEEGDGTVKVQWDMGSTSICKAESGSLELRILDTASIGVTHPNSGCVSCEEVCIAGTLWSCTTCQNTNLCSICYHNDKHDVKHIFSRIDYPGSEPVQLTKRLTSQKARALGIYPNAIVKRGPDWEHEDQDGGPGHHGTVEDVLSFGQDASDRNAVRVRWDKGYKGIYRVGHQGHVDLECIEEAPGGPFYPAHLAPLDLAIQRRFEKTLFDILSVGDKVCVEVTSAQLKQLQQSRRNWNTRMEEIIGDIGVVKGFTSEGDVEVDYGGDTITFVKAAVCKVSTHCKGDKVKVTGNRDKMKRLQRKHCGWDDGMEDVINQIGEVSVVDKDGDVGVIFDDGAGFVFHPACLLTVQKANDSESDDDEDNEDMDEGQIGTNPDESTESGDEADGSNVNLMQALAGLLLLEALTKQPDASEEQTFVNVVCQGNEADVQQMLKRCPDFKDIKHNGIPILSIATYQGHMAVINTLIEAGADINAKDEKGNSALMVAISTDKGDVAKLLMSRNADVNTSNVDGHSAVHAAAGKNMTSVLRLLLEHGCDPNLQDVAGDTPLHDAISERHDEAAAILIEHPKIDVWIQNVREFNVIHVACMKGHASAVDKLLTKDPKLATCAKSDGFMPLHIASINNNINEASILLVKGRADVNAKTMKKQTALHIAAAEAYFDMVKLLLTYEADWSIKDVEGNTALHLCMSGRRTNDLFLHLMGLRNLAEDSERVKIANFMIQHGASINDKNNQGNTPITGCPIQHMQEAVSNFAAKNKPTPAHRPKARPKTAKVEQEIFTSSTQMCHKCSEATADIRFLPCKHKISCQKCCFKFKRCPICDKEITKRMDKNNHAVESGCVIS